jgi:hypothetical protein
MFRIKFGKKSEWAWREFPPVLQQEKQKNRRIVEIFV